MRDSGFMANSVMEWLLPVSSHLSSKSIISDTNPEVKIRSAIHPRSKPSVMEEDFSPLKLKSFAEQFLIFRIFNLNKSLFFPN
jgi:hypothetical protein